MIKVIQVRKVLLVQWARRAPGVKEANEAPERMTTTTKLRWHSSEALRVHRDHQGCRDETACQDTKETPGKSVRPVRLDLVDWTACPVNQASKDHQVYQVTKVLRERRAIQATSDLQV